MKVKLGDQLGGYGNEDDFVQGGNCGRYEKQWDSGYISEVGLPGFADGLHKVSRRKKYFPSSVLSTMRAMRSGQFKDVF